ncbi:MAG: phosphate-starvation-inducible PsiE family protein [Rhodospirillaceae bacterium]|jgi:uncharacterized membrane protein (DUF373 family)
MKMPFKNFFIELSDKWPDLSTFERFERTIALILAIIVGIVTILATFRLAGNFYISIVLKENFLKYVVFQSTFGAIMVVLIALEFNRSIAAILTGKSALFQAKSIILIGILALVRKFIILDTAKTPPETVIGLAVATVALAGVYWLLNRSGASKSPESN